jgi:hypothetical protein
MMMPIERERVHGARESRTFLIVGDGTPVNLKVSETGEWIAADKQTLVLAPRAALTRMRLAPP